MDFVKENRMFWVYIIGTIILMILIMLGGWYFLAGREIFGPSDEDNVPSTFDNPPEYTLDTTKNYFAEFKTNYGTFKVDLYEVGAPVNVNNFVFLAQVGYYNNLSVNRMIADLLLQSGSRGVLNENPNDDLESNPGYTVRDEINWDSLDLSDEKREGLENEGYTSDPDAATKEITKYSLVMANADSPNTAGSQYFIIIGDEADPRFDYFNGRHTPIGEVVEGFEVLDNIRTISAIEDEENENVTVPEQEVIIESVSIIVDE
jgi:peptidyl-prolyl cis-trans isomerase B (cyclophilin B)